MSFDKRRGALEELITEHNNIEKEDIKLKALVKSLKRTIERCVDG